MSALFSTLRNLLIFFLLSVVLVPSAQGRIVFENEFVSDQVDGTLVIDVYDDVAPTANISLQFGSSLGENLTFDVTNGWFAFSNNVNFNQNELLGVVFENQATAPVTPLQGQIYHNTTDGNTYIYNGSTWDDITAISSTATKVVTVGTGLDYATIQDAAAYLNTLSGGMILLSAETHTVSTAIDLRNITLIGKGPAQTTIAVNGAGQMDAFDTRFINLFLDVNALTATYAIDVQPGSSALRFEYINLDIQDSGDSLIDSSAGSPPTTNITFVNSDEVGGAGVILKTMGIGNLAGGTTIFVSAARGNNLLQLGDWDVTIEGAGNVYTTGAITTIPDNTIVVYPGMDVQGAVSSLPNGGSITLLPGVHTISEPLLVLNDSIEINGNGEASRVVASGFSGITDETAAIQVGAANGSAPVDGVKLGNFKLEVASNIHGIRVAGGDDNQVNNVTVQKTAGTSGNGASANIGILMIDSTTGSLIRPIVQNSRVQGNGGAVYFTDGIHVTSDDSITGVFGYNNGVQEALIEGNNVDYVRETGYVFVGVTNSSLFNNRVSRMGAGGGGSYGVYMGNMRNVNMTANVFSGSLSTASIAVGIESFNVGAAKTTNDSIFANNIVDGLENAGVGFGTGFQIGATTNTTVNNNVFSANTIKGASTATTVAAVIRGNADENVFIGNQIIGGTNPWDTGFEFQSAQQEQNVLASTNFAQTTQPVDDSSTALVKSTALHEDTTNPTVNDDSGDGYEQGTVWVNTTANIVYVLLDDTPGAAVWRRIDEGSATLVGVDSDSFTIDLDDSATSVALIFGNTFDERLTWNNPASQFELSDDVFVEGILDIGGTTITLDEDNAGGGNTVSIIAEQGTDPNGELRYNATTNQWELENDGGGFEPIATRREIVQVFNNIGVTNVNTGGLTAVPFTAQTRVDGSYNHSVVVNNSQVTMVDPGWYRASYSVGYDGDNTRKTIRCQGRLDGTTTINPSTAYAYSRNNTDDKAATAATFIFETTGANQYIEVVCQQEGSGGTATLIANETWLLIEELD